MSFISTSFVYDGIKSDDMGISLIKTSSGLIERQLYGEREIIHEFVAGNNTPYIFGERIQPLSVSLQLSPLENEWTPELKSKVSRWLNNGKFNEFYSLDEIDRRYFLTYIGSPTLSVTGNNQGYITVDFLNIDCYVRSPSIHKIFNFPTSNQNEFELDNLGDGYVYPDYMKIKKIGDGDIEIISLTDGGKLFSLKNLLDGEEVYIDNRNRVITSSIEDVYRYDDFNGNYLRLVYGINKFSLTGACHLEFKYRYQYLS